MENYRKTYITWFLILVLPAILIRLATYSGEMALSEDLAVLLTIISKTGMIVITIWYGLKVGIANFWAWALGLSTLLPLMTWISLIILLTRKSDNTTKSKQSSTQIKQSHTNIKNELENIYIPIFEMTMGKSHSEAKKTFNDMYNKIAEEAKNEGTANLSLNYGDKLLSIENSDEKIKKMLSKKRIESVTDTDIKWWWNMHDYERRIMLKVDEMNRVALFINEIQNSKSNNKEKVSEEASKKVRKFHPMYGNPDDTTHTTGDDRPLPYELKDRINIYIEKRAKKDPDKYKNEIENSSTFNFLIRKEIKAGNL